jgi:hypothetical protein
MAAGVAQQTPRILARDPEWATAFRRYWESTGRVNGNLETMVSKGQVLPLAWREFLASRYAPTVASIAVNPAAQALSLIHI